MLQKKNETLMSRLRDCEEEILKEEQRSAALSREVDELSHWKVTYENGHGLQELARHQKKMKEDQRRLGLTLEQMSAQLSDTIESKNLLETAFYKLKIESGKGEDFEYSTLELRDEMKGETAKLRLQVAELEEQIRGLEDDSVKFRKALKNQAASFGENGFKYAGMTPEQLLKVNEFANNLREGRTELPLDNRSTSLLKDNRQLREDLRLAQLKINRYELELCGLGDDQPPQNNIGGVMQSGQQIHRNEQAEAELQGLRVDVRNLLHENVSLRSSMQHMKDEISMLLQQQLLSGDVKGKDGRADNLVAMLMSNNDSLIKENAELRHQVLNASSKAPHAEHKPPLKHSTDAHQPKPEIHTDSDALQSQAPSSQPPLHSQRTPVKPPPRLSIPAHQQHTPGGLDSVNLNNTMGTGRRGGAAGTGVPDNTSGNTTISLGTPRTPHGKTVLSRTVAAMGPLPPEEWADELKEVNGQLIECLEQLFQKEEELNQQNDLLKNMESYLVETKQQLSIMYVDNATQYDSWERKEKQLKDEAADLRGQRDDLKLKLRRVEETLDLLNRKEEGVGDDSDNSQLVTSLQDTIREYSRKLTVYEVNEAVLCRKFTTLNEQMVEESNKRRDIEEQFAEMEGVLKRRILYLENCKAQVEPHVAKLQCLLDNSVPRKDYNLVENELESLRQDHLHALRRELDARVNALDSNEKSRQIRLLKKQIGNLQAELKESREMQESARLELENQKDVTQRALRTINSGGGKDYRRGGSNEHHDVGALVTELAKFRGDASRLHVELDSREYRLDQTEGRLKEAIQDLEQVEKRELELMKRCDEAEASEKRIRKALLDLEALYDGGLKRDEAEKLRKELEEWKDKSDNLQQQNNQLKELAQIAYDQAQSMANIRDNYVEEVAALREHLVLHESRSDDDLIIGRLQRQLMATKTAYKAFTRKYQVLRGNMRQRELTQRVLEQRLDQRDVATMQFHETSRLEIGALRKALQSVHEKMISSSHPLEKLKAKKVETGGLVEGGVDKSRRAKHCENAEQFEFQDRIKRILHGKFDLKLGHRGIESFDGDVLSVAGASSIGEKMALMSQQIECLAELAEGAGNRAIESEAKVSHLAGELDTQKEDNTILRQTIKNLNDLLESSGYITGGAGGGSNAVNKKQMHTQSKALAAKLLAISEENRTLKISSLQHRREVAAHQQEKQHLRAVVARLEEDLREIELNGQGNLHGDREQQELKLLEGFGIGSFDDFDNINFELGLGLQPVDQAQNKNDIGVKEDTRHDAELKQIEGNKKSPLQKRLGKELHIDTSADNQSVTATPRQLFATSNITKDELLNKNEQLTEELLSTQRDLSGFKRQCEHMQQRLREAQDGLAERDEAIRYYERQASAENLPLAGQFVNADVGGGMARARTGKGGIDFKIMRDEQEKLQEAASATIGSMRSLLDDKNKEIERLRNKLEGHYRLPPKGKGGNKGGLDDYAGRNSSHMPSVADRRAEELLERLAAEERYASHFKGHGHGKEENSRAKGETNLVQRLMDQIDRADEILQDKMKTVSQLELKLSTAHAQREKAEQRCGATLEEMENMKQDMVMLVDQLKESEEKYMKIAQYNQVLAGSASTAPIITDIDNEDPQQQVQTINLQIKALKRKNNDLTAAVKNKDEKMKQYRNIIIGLKEEFIKSEEERAIFETKNMGKSGANVPLIDKNGEIETLRDQVLALRDGLRQAKQDIEVAKRAREKLQAARAATMQENDALEGQLGRAESQAGAAQQALQRCRRDLEESRKREVRLRHKVKDLTDRLEDGELKDQDSIGVGGVTARLKREIEALRTENTILRKRVGSEGRGLDQETAESVSKVVSDALDRSEGNVTTNIVSINAPPVDDVDPESEVVDQGNGRVLGSGAGEGGSALGDLRRQLHNKWEAEKRLQKRLATLEVRLKEKVDECNEVGERLRRAQQLINQQSTQIGQAKDQQQKESRRKSAAAGDVRNTSHSTEDRTAINVQLEETRQKVFELEEENERLRRVAMVELPNELSSLRHRCDTYAARVTQLEQELEDAEHNLKSVRYEQKGMSGQLRASEDRFVQTERLKEELHAARKQRLELEANLLERDSKSLELRFEVESKENENMRLRRRLKELESVSRALQQQQAADGVSLKAGRPTTTGKMGVTGSNGPESVIESLRKVVDKLKGENERLRRGIGVDENKQQRNSTAPAAGSDKDRKLLALEKKKNSRLEDEVKELQAKIQQLEDGGQKLVQRQQQVASLRKQLKSKEDRVSQAGQRINELEGENVQMKQRLSDSHNRVQQLEMQLATSQSAAAHALSSAQRSQHRQGESNAERDKELFDLKRKASDAALEVQALKAQLNETRRELRQALDAGTGPTGGAISRVTAEEQQLLKKLKTENARLKDELSAFDLDFFEEIENLKYAHAEATKQLKWYEKKYGVMR